MLDLNMKLEENAVVNYTEGRKILASVAHQKPADIPLDEHIKAHPELYPKFQISFAGWTINEVMEAAAFNTALIDTMRAKFRDEKTTDEERKEFLGKFTIGPDGRYELVLTADDMKNPFGRKGRQPRKSDKESTADYMNRRFKELRTLEPNPDKRKKMILAELTEMLNDDEE